MERLPLYSYRILDLTAGWAGAYGTRLLADMGAEVIKVEALDSARTPTRVAGARLGEGPTRSATFKRLNRNKYACTLDLAQSRGRDLFLRLVALSDAVVEDDRPPVWEELGLSYDALRSARADIILVSLSPTSQMAGAGYGEPAAGVAAAGAVALALWHRRRTGEGQHVDVGGWETMVGLIGEQVVGYSMKSRLMPQVITEALQATGLPTGQAGVTALFDDPHLRARGFWESVSHPEDGTRDMDGVPWRLSRSPAHIRLPAPRFGEHNDYVLRGLLGLSEREVRELGEAGVIGGGPGPDVRA
jgi:crotonobetainyl-CoA:carnitine CoA-transferase CaiB-like acyl-CoA transferase